MDAIYDQGGDVTAWRDDDEIYGLNGFPRAFIVSAVVYSYDSGAVLGWFMDGHYRDLAGDVVAFEPGASGGPAKPGLSGRPGMPGRAGRPGKPGRHGVPGRPGFSSSWSRQSWDQWIGDDEHDD